MNRHIKRRINQLWFSGPWLCGALAAIVIVYGFLATMKVFK